MFNITSTRLATSCEFATSQSRSWLSLKLTRVESWIWIRCKFGNFLWEANKHKSLIVKLEPESSIETMPSPAIEDIFKPALECIITVFIPASSVKFRFKSFVPAKIDGNYKETQRKLVKCKVHYPVIRYNYEGRLGNLLFYHFTYRLMCNCIKCCSWSCAIP